jgi:hypothetical protein
MASNSFQKAILIAAIPAVAAVIAALISRWPSAAESPALTSTKRVTSPNAIASSTQNPSPPPLVSDYDAYIETNYPEDLTPLNLVPIDIPSEGWITDVDSEPDIDAKGRTSPPQIKDISVGDRTVSGFHGDTVQMGNMSLVRISALAIQIKYDSHRQKRDSEHHDFLIEFSTPDHKQVASGSIEVHPSWFQQSGVTYIKPKGDWQAGKYYVQVMYDDPYVPLARKVIEIRKVPPASQH